LIKRIRIEGYKSFRNFELELAPLTVIMGPNASGKSNLIDAIYLLSRMVTRKNLKEAFEGHRGLPLESFYYGDEGYEKLLQKPSLQLSFEVDVELGSSVIESVESIVRAKRKGIDSGESRNDKKIITERRLRYSVSLEVLTETGYVRIRDERLCAVKANGKEKKSRNPFLEKAEGKNEIRLRMEGQAHPISHSIGLDYTVVSTPLYEPHYPHITAFRMELANWATYYLEPRILMREDVPLAEIESLGPRGENLAAFLNTLKHRYSQDFDSLNLSLKRILPTGTTISIEHLKEGRVGLRLSENGLWFSARLISEGTLRLIGLLAAIHPRSPATVVAFEEPENGVHPVRLKIISDILKRVANDYGKQIIVTTHSPILPEYFDDESLFICQKEGAQTVIKPLHTGPLLRKQDVEHALEDRILRGDLGG